MLPCEEAGSGTRSLEIWLLGMSGATAGSSQKQGPSDVGTTGEGTLGVGVAGVELQFNPGDPGSRFA
jgi:hypothetical protein